MIEAPGANLAFHYRQAGRVNDTITIVEQVATDSERILGTNHPDKVAATKMLWAWRGEG